jgi:hypothetical protein
MGIALPLHLTYTKTQLQEGVWGEWMFYIELALNTWFVVLLTDCHSAQSPPYFFFCDVTAQLGRRPPHCSGFYITHTRAVGLLWTSDQLVAEATTYTAHNQHKR